MSKSFSTGVTCKCLSENLAAARGALIVRRHAATLLRPVCRVARTGKQFSNDFVEGLCGSDLILHAGDIGSGAVIAALEEIAPDCRSGE